MKNILLSGGTSYLGQNLINYLAKENNVTVLVRDAKKLSIINNNLDFQIVDVKNLDTNILTKEKYDIYINLISSNKKISSFSTLVDSINSNIIFNKKIVKILINSNVENFIQINSYWQLLKGWDVRKFSLYVFGKNYITKFLEKNRRRYSFKLFTFYLGDIYGKKDFRNKLIPELLKNNNLIIENENGKFFPDYVNDIVLSIARAVDQELEQGKYLTFDECFYVKDIQSILLETKNQNHDIKKLNIEKYLKTDSIKEIYQNKKSIIDWALDINSK